MCMDRTNPISPGLDAVQAAPQSHKVILENAFVRVPEVSVSEPVHSVEILDAPVAKPGLRIEVKCLP